jgi:hypothetical protein
MNVFAIRHKPSGLFLPPPFGRSGRGGSHSEPAEGLPRIFLERRRAEFALRAWLQGKYVRTFIPSNEFGGEEDRVDLEPQPHRKAEEMEIVEFALVEIANER